MLVAVLLCHSHFVLRTAGHVALCGFLHFPSGDLAVIKDIIHLLFIKLGVTHSLKAGMVENARKGNKPGKGIVIV